MSKWAFNLQIFFLSLHCDQVDRIKKKLLSISVIQERCLEEDANVFAMTQYKLGYLSTRDYKNYLNIHKSVMRYVKPPDLLIYLRKDVTGLLKQINKRGRFENEIGQEYISNLNSNYESWVTTCEFKKIIIDTNHLDFVEKEDDFHFIVGEIEAGIASLR